MGYGHAERNLALIHQLEADVRRLRELRGGPVPAEWVEGTGHSSDGRQGHGPAGDDWSGGRPR
jgi:hypothetical protein